VLACSCVKSRRASRLPAATSTRSRPLPLVSRRRLGALVVSRRPSSPARRSATTTTATSSGPRRAHLQVAGPPPAEAERLKEPPLSLRECRRPDDGNGERAGARRALFVVGAASRAGCAIVRRATRSPPRMAGQQPVGRLDWCATSTTQRVAHKTKSVTYDNGRRRRLWPALSAPRPRPPPPRERPPSQDGRRRTLATGVFCFGVLVSASAPFLIGAARRPEPNT
jgi:hypothetical protein